MLDFVVEMWLELLDSIPDEYLYTDIIMKLKPITDL